jgi:protein N-terminal methyltransferase
MALPPSRAPDAEINHTASLNYWSSISPDVHGMLGGFPQISRADVQGSANFLAKLRRLEPSPQKDNSRPFRAADCGAGIGRVTHGFLAKACDVVDIVEPIEKFVAEIREGEAFRALREKGRIGDIFTVGLEDWRPERGHYGLIWNQWCVGHLKDEQLVAYLKRCGAALSSGGWVVVKENLSTGHEDVFDPVDSSVTR